MQPEGLSCIKARSQKCNLMDRLQLSDHNPAQSPVTLTINRVCEPFMSPMERVQCKSLRQFLFKDIGYDAMPVDRQVAVIRKIQVGFTLIKARAQFAA